MQRSLPTLIVTGVLIAFAGAGGFFLGAAPTENTINNGRSGDWTAETIALHSEGDDYISYGICTDSKDEGLSLCIAGNYVSDAPRYHRGPGITFVVHYEGSEISGSKWPIVSIDGLPLPPPAEIPFPVDLHGRKSVYVLNHWDWNEQVKWSDRMDDPAINKLLTGKRIQATVYLQNGEELTVDVPLGDMQIILEAMIPVEVKTDGFL